MDGARTISEASTSERLGPVASLAAAFAAGAAAAYAYQKWIHAHNVRNIRHASSRDTSYGRVCKSVLEVRTGFPCRRVFLRPWLAINGTVFWSCYIYATNHVVGPW